MVMMSFVLTATASGASTRDQRSVAWSKATMMHYRQMTARANGAPSPTWPRLHCEGQCPRLIRSLRAQRRSAEHAWNQIRYGADRAAVKKIIRFWFSRGGRLVLADAMTVADCENDFVASNGPSPTGDWGAWQVNYIAHSRAFGNDDASFYRTVNDPWEATQVAWRWSDHGTNFSPTWTCATIKGIA